MTTEDTSTEAAAATSSVTADSPVTMTPVVPQGSLGELADYEEKKENRQFKHWVLKVLTIVVSLTFSIVVSAFVWGSIKNPGNNSENASVIKNFLDTILEMFKIMKS